MLLVGSSVGRNLLVVLLESSEILTGLRELSLLHTFTDVPVDEGALGVHEIELLVDAGEDRGDGSRVRKHADGALGGGHLGAGDNDGGLSVDTALETSGAPFDELDGGLVLDTSEGRRHILGENISTVHQAAGHVLSSVGVALAESVLGLEDGVGDLSNRVLLVEGLIGGDDGGVGRQQEVDTGVGDQVGLELVHIHVQGSLEAERAGEGRDDLRDKTVEVGVGGALNIQSTVADLVDGLVIEQEGAISVLQEGVGREDGVVGLNDGSRNLGRRVDAEVQLRLLGIIDRQALQKERAETRSSSSSNGVEDHESLQTLALISELADALQNGLNLLLSDGVVSTSVVVGSILLTRDELGRVEELLVLRGTDGVNDGRLQISEDSAGDILASSSVLCISSQFTKETML